MKIHKVAVIAGDGIGPEVIAEGVKVLEAAAKADGSFAFEFTHFPWGCEYYLKTGRMMPADALETLKGFDAIFLGAVGYPGVPDHISLRDLLLEIRHGFDEYVNVRPVKLLKGAPCPLSGVKREEIFLTTKQWTDVRGYEKTVEAGEKALKALGTDYIDLYLVHWPAVLKYSAQWQELNAATWKGFEKLYKDGKVRAIGVSNFLPEHLAALKQQCEIPPMVDQVEFHPGYIQKDVLDYCNQNNIRMEAWSPLGSGRMLANPLLNEIGAAHGKSAAQVCVRYAIELGVVPLPKSVHAERLAANADVFDFSLTAEELAALNAMPETGYSGYNPNDAPAEQ